MKRTYNSTPTNLFELSVALDDNDQVELGEEFCLDFEDFSASTLRAFKFVHSKIQLKSLSLSTKVTCTLSNTTRLIPFVCEPLEVFFKILSSPNCKVARLVLKDVTRNFSKNTNNLCCCLPMLPKFLELLQGSNSITELNLNLDFSNFYFDDLCDFIGKTTTLQILCIVVETFQLYSCENIFDKLLENNSINSISLCGFILEVNCAQKLKKILLKPGKLQRLYLNLNDKIQPRAYPIIFESLVGNNTLTELLISLTFHCNPSTVSLEKYFQETTTLKCLQLVGNCSFKFSENIVRIMANLTHFEFSCHLTDKLTIISERNRGTTCLT